MFCYDTALYSSGSIVYSGILTCDNPAKSISHLSINCMNIILCLLNFVLFLCNACNNC